MPNGYTAGVIDGTDGVREYLEKCARSRGFAIMQRDDRMDVPVKYREEQAYYQNHYDEAVNELAAWGETNDAQRRVLYDEYVARTKESNRKSQFKAAQATTACNDVIADINSLDWPEDLHSMRDDAIKWLEETAEWDGRAYTSKVEPFSEWCKSRTESLKRGVVYATESLERERKNVEETNRYIDLYHSVLEQLDG